MNVITPAAPMAKLLSYIPFPILALPAKSLTTLQLLCRKHQIPTNTTAVWTTILMTSTTFSADIVWLILSCMVRGHSAPKAEARFPLASQVTRLARNQSLALGYTYAITPALIADFRFGFYRYRVHNLPERLRNYPGPRRRPASG